MNKIIDQLHTVLTSSVKTPRGIVQIYKGDPIFIPNVNMPAITINPVSTATETVDNCRDLKLQTLEVVVILDARKYFNANDTETGLLEASKIMEEEDVNLKLETDTILFAIRDTLYKDAQYSLKTESETISYEFNFREFPTIEVSLTFTIQRVPYLRS